MTARDRILFGMDEPAPPWQTLTAGRLSVEFDGAALRSIRWKGYEVLRGIAFVVRNTHWGTYAPRIAGLDIRQRMGSFEVAYEGRVEGPDGQFCYAAKIEADGSGRLWFMAQGRSPGGFCTNRTGFVVLHPIEGAAGRALEVGHTDGTITRTAFPELVSPHQPAFGIARLRHESAPGLSAAVRFTGDAFEMEDHRNWTDASFKTYVRPLSRGYPYRIEAGETLSQEVELVVTGGAPSISPLADTVIDVHWGEPEEGRMPGIGLYADEDVLSSGWERLDAIAGLGASYVQARVDLSHSDSVKRLDQSLGLARTCRCPLQLDVIIPGTAPVPELTPLVSWVANAHPPPEALFVIPHRDFRSRPAGNAPSGEAGADAILDAVRRLFPGLRCVGGMPTGFAELNRNRPPPGIDMATHATQAVVHAADDASVMETLEALPSLIATTRSFIGAVPYRIGPATIGMPPSASAAPPVSNAGGCRVPMGLRDPRQRGLFAAAFLFGYVAAARGVEALTLAAPAGDFGLFDSAGQTLAIGVAFEIASKLSGTPRLTAAHDAPGQIAAFTGFSVRGPVLCMANLTSKPIEVRPNGPAAQWIRMIDADRLSHMPAGHIAPERLRSPVIKLDSYAVVCLSNSWGTDSDTSSGPNLTLGPRPVR